MLFIVIFVARHSVIIIIVLVSSDVLVYVLLKIAKKALIFEVFKSFIIQVHGKKTKYCNWSSITSDVQRQISELLKRIKSSFIALHIAVLSFKDISCSMHLIVY